MMTSTTQIALQLMDLDAIHEERLRRLAQLPPGAAKTALVKDAEEEAKMVSFLRRKLQLAEAYAHYVAEGRWTGAPYLPTRPEKAALRRYLDKTTLGPVEVAHNVAREIYDDIDALPRR